MMAFVCTALFAVAGFSAFIALIDSAIQGVNTHKQLRHASRACKNGQIVRVSIIEPAGLKNPAPFKLPRFTRLDRPVAANCSQPLPAAA